MRGPAGGLLGVALLVCGAGTALGADPDPRGAREHEMLRRTQEALHQSQAENADLAAQKSAVEKQADEKLKAAAAELDSSRKASKSAQAALHGQLDAAAAAQAELTRKLAEANQQIAAQTSQQQAAAEQLKRTQQELDASKASNLSCETKNTQLYQYSRELMTRYQQKGVWAALAQKEPVTGIKEVGIENVLQEYQQKLDTQRVKPAKAP
jgi:chromosome segregation ATPase